MTARPRPHWLATHVPVDPARWPFFYGWVVVAVGTLGILASIPGQTIGVSAFTDSLLAATNLSRVGLSNAYLLGTLGSAALLPRGGYLLDRWGARRAAMAASLGLGLTLCLLSGTGRLAEHLSLTPSPVFTFVALTLSFVALRFTGQGMLTLVSRNMIGKWFDRRRGLAAAISGLFVSFGFASAPLLFSTFIDRVGWRATWLAFGVLVSGGMALFAWAFFRDNPEECGLEMDGGAVQGTSTGRTGATGLYAEFTRAEAIRTLAFWVVTLALSFHGLIMTGFTFHIVDAGSEAGLDRASSVSFFLPMAVVSTVTGFLVGHFSDRTTIRRLVAVMMVCQAAGLLGALHMGSAVGFAFAVGGLGMTGGFFGPLSTVALPRYFGRTHLGAISGLQMMAMVFASALGPSLLALSRSLTGSYGPGLLGSLIMPVTVLALALAQRPAR